MAISIFAFLQFRQRKIFPLILILVYVLYDKMKGFEKLDILKT